MGAMQDNVRQVQENGKFDYGNAITTKYHYHASSRINTIFWQVADSRDISG